MAELKYHRDSHYTIKISMQCVQVDMMYLSDHGQPQLAVVMMIFVLCEERSGEHLQHYQCDDEQDPDHDGDNGPDEGLA